MPGERRQAIAQELGFSETVFVDDTHAARLRIYTPALELPFAGHPMVGTAWLLAREGLPVRTLRPPAGEIAVRTEGELVFVSARPEWAPPFSYIQLDSPDAVDALPIPPAGSGWRYCWAWEDEVAGRVRARSFVDEAGIPEDEATGAAALALCGQLGREIFVRQGRGSEIIARPVAEGRVAVGGRTLLDELREHAV